MNCPYCKSIINKLDITEWICNKQDHCFFYNESLNYYYLLIGLNYLTKNFTGYFFNDLSVNPFKVEDIYPTMKRLLKIKSFI